MNNKQCDFFVCDSVLIFCRRRRRRRATWGDVVAEATVNCTNFG